MRSVWNHRQKVRGLLWLVCIVLAWSRFQSSNLMTTSSIESFRNQKQNKDPNPNRNEKDPMVVVARNTNTTATYRTSGSTKTLPRNVEDDDKSWKLEPLAKDMESAMTQDILSIWHDPEKAAILVYLRSNANCSNPALRGRLSGPALILLQEWKTVDPPSPPPASTLASSSYILRRATYEAPLKGSYFLEIVALFCDDWSSPYPRLSEPGLAAEESTEIGLSYLARQHDLRNSCLINPREHRITELGCRIRVPHSDPLGRFEHGSSYGFWKWAGSNVSRSSMEPHPTKDSEGIPSPVYTRWQPEECALEQGAETKEIDRAACEPFVGVDRFRNWEWSWRIPIDANLVQEASHKIQVCFVGWSHSRVLIEQARVEGWKAHWVPVKYPFEVNLALIQEHYCDIAVLGLGQWAFSSRIEDVTLDVYNNWIHDMLTNLTAPGNKTIRHNTTTRMESEDLPTHRLQKLIFRSLHDNPLGERKLRCPSVDYRNPVTMSAANRILLEQVRAYQVKADPESNGPRTNVVVEYLDTNRIVAPMWDAGEDWNHIGPTVSKIELLYILAFALNLLPKAPRIPEEGFHNQERFA